MNYVLIGAGGHARAVVEAQRLNDARLDGYVDPKPSAWLDAPQIDMEDLEPGTRTVLGLGGTTPAQLSKRLTVLHDYLTAGMTAPSVVHPTAWVSPDATLADGAILLARAVVQPGATIGLGAIVNTGAIVEHDSAIGDGSHVAPGAIVLGACQVGRHCMIGAGSVVLPGHKVDDDRLVKAATRYPR